MVRRTWIWTLNGALLYIGIQLMSWIHVTASVMISGWTPMSKSLLHGCELNAECTTPGQFCYTAQGRGGGQLWCDVSDSSNKHYVTSCTAGYYCGPDAFSDGCTSEGGQELICSHIRKQLVPGE